MRHRPSRRIGAQGHVLGILLGTLALVTATPAIANDYPTEARVDYVLGCMAANGQGRLVMQRCSCSIDVIAEQIPYEQYEAVETILSMHDQRGELGVLFRTERGLQEQVEAFRAAQTEADLRCF